MAIASKKNVILETATLLFSKYGYHTVGIDRIIAEAKIAKMTLYKHFPSKEKLIEEVLQSRDNNLRKVIMEAVNSHTTPLEKLKSIFHWYSDWFVSGTFHGCMFIKAIEEHTEEAVNIKEISKGHKLWLIALIESLLVELNTKNERELASHIMMVLDGLTVSFNMFHGANQDQVERAWAYTESLITHNAKEINN
jgi:AcrR family transcriptional regulator